jgi:hypothetical protein
MAYQLTVEQKAGYLHIRVTGENSPETVRRYLEEVFYTCLQANCPIVLIEEDLRGPGLGVIDIHQIVTEGSKRTWPTVRRIAYVDVNKEHSQSDMHFAETLAVNLGVNVKLFPTVNEAEEWLLDAAPPTVT